MDIARAAMIGDVVGSQGLEILEARLPELIKEYNIDFVTVNGENAADGFGMTVNDFKRIIAAGADVVTSGNHIWEKREFWPVLESEEKMLRPANYPSSANSNTCAPGLGIVRIEKNGIGWAVINLQGREFMSAIDCPFQCFDQLVKLLTDRAVDRHPLLSNDGTPLPGVFPVILVDFHAESSREKEALAYYVDGRVSLIAGTHTHVQTADERILPNGSAYITDLGMTGVNDSVIGMDPKICQERFCRQVQYQMKVAAGETAQIHGVIAEIEINTGKAVSIRRI
jgi:metallophosphoesterase (TIGR00282 family)